MPVGRSLSDSRQSDAAAGSANLRRALGVGALVTLIVFSGFALYAFLSRATYRTQAAIRVDPPDAPRRSPTPSAAAAALRAALVDRTLYDRIVADAANGASPAAREVMARRVCASIEVTSSDARVFQVSLLDRDPERAERLGNLVAETLAERAPRALAPETPPEQRARESEQKRRAAELAAFVAAHPELASESPTASPRRDDGNEAALSALRAERAQIEARLASAAPPPAAPAAGADNPYEDPSTLDPNAPTPARAPVFDPDTALLKRRLLEINAAIQARRTASQRQGGPAASVAPEVRAEWQRLLKAVAQSAEARPAPAAPPLSARVVTRAARPASPIEPDRPLLLLVGAMIALGTGVLLAVSWSALGGRRRPARGPRPTEPLPLLPSVAKEAPPGVRIGSPPLAAAPIISVSRKSPDSPVMTSSDPQLSAVSESRPAPALDDLTRTLASASEHPAAAPGSDPSELADGPIARAPSSHPPHRGAVIEVNAPLVMREGDDLEPAAAAAHRLPRDPMTRVTQVLGSPLPPPPGPEEAPAHATPPSHVSTQRSHTPSSTSTSYSYVSTAPPASAPPSSPPPSPRKLRSHVSSRPPASDGAGAPRSPLPPAPSSRSGQPVVSPRALPGPFQPDPGMLAASRRALASELYPLAVEQCFVIGVTGLRKTGEETSRVAAEIAVALAETGHPRVLLLEGNLQRPAIQRWLHLEMPLFAGFSEQLDSRVQTGERRPWTVLECTPSLHVLAEGVMRTPELILSPVFEECVRELRGYYDFVVIDGPLTSELAAYRALHEVVDGVVLVSPRGDSPEIAEASALFSEKRFSTVLAAG